MTELKISGVDGILLWVGAGDLAQVPLKPSERALCRQALLDALTRLDQAQVRPRVPLMEDGAERVLRHI